MREEHKLNKAIRQDGADTQSDILEELKRRYPQYVEQAPKKQAHKNKRKFAVISAIAAAVVCAAVIVPCAVLLPNSNNGADKYGNGRYCTQDEYRRESVNYTVLEYRETHNKDFLCFDWYALCDDCNAWCYVSISDNEVLCLEEQVYFAQSDEIIQLSITKSNVYLSEFDAAINRCKDDYAIDDHTVKWSANKNETVGILEDGGYRYFIRIWQGRDENRLFKLVAELLEKK